MEKFSLSKIRIFGWFNSSFFVLCDKLMVEKDNWLSPRRLRHQKIKNSKTWIIIVGRIKITSFEILSNSLTSLCSQFYRLLRWKCSICFIENLAERGVILLYCPNGQLSNLTSLKIFENIWKRGVTSPLLIIFNVFL